MVMEVKGRGRVASQLDYKWPWRACLLGPCWWYTNVLVAWSTTQGRCHTIDTTPLLRLGCYAFELSLLGGLGLPIVVHNVSYSCAKEVTVSCPVIRAEDSYSFNPLVEDKSQATVLCYRESQGNTRAMYLLFSLAPRRQSKILEHSGGVSAAREQEKVLDALPGHIPTMS